ncbi:MAG: DUF177 domain-containing protein [Chloroflexota bacterium]|nr:DUF177 domain-containing protein [Chloroflexota bacterium]
MRYNVAQLLKDETGQTREYALHEDIARLDPDISPLSTLEGRVHFIRTADGVLVTGSLRSSIELVCSRCAEMFSMPLKFNLEEEFRPTIDIVTGASLPLPVDDDAATRIDEHHILDLTEVVRQDLLLAIPPHPLCRSRCAGLCPTCGKNWNDGPCACSHDEIDPRLLVLNQLLDEQS